MPPIMIKLIFRADNVPYTLIKDEEKLKMFYDSLWTNCKLKYSKNFFYLMDGDLIRNLKISFFGEFGLYLSLKDSLKDGESFSSSRWLEVNPWGWEEAGRGRMRGSRDPLCFRVSCGPPCGQTA